MRGLLDAAKLAADWVRTGRRSQAEAELFLHAQGVSLEAVIAEAVQNVYTEGFLVGERSALSVIAGVGVDWGGWVPGNPEAARALIGADMNLANLLNDAGITIRSIASNRLDELAAALADGLTRGDSVDTIAAALRGVLDNPAWADLVAVTETTRAVSYATQQTYLANGITQNIWITAADTRVCLRCEQNEAYGPVNVGDDFPSGQSMPPAHPACRCALSAVV